MTQDGLVKVTLWCIGEYGLDLTNGNAKGPDGKPIRLTEKEVIALIEKAINRLNAPESIKEYALNCLIKLYPSFSNSRTEIKNLIDSQTTSAYLEVQQRACEYLQLLEGEWDNIRAAIVEKMPVSNTAAKDFGDKPVGDKEIDEVLPQKNVVGGQDDEQLVVTNQVDMRQETAVQDLLDLDMMTGTGGPADQSPAVVETRGSTTNTATTGANLFDLDLLGDSAPTSQNTVSPIHLTCSLLLQF